MLIVVAWYQHIQMDLKFWSKLNCIVQSGIGEPILAMKVRDCSDVDFQRRQADVKIEQIGCEFENGIPFCWQFLKMIGVAEVPKFFLSR